MFVVTITVGILGGILSHVSCHDNSGHTRRNIESCFFVRITVYILGGILSHVCCHENSGHTGRNIESCLVSR